MPNVKKIDQSSWHHTVCMAWHVADHSYFKIYGRLTHTWEEGGLGAAEGGLEEGDSVEEGVGPVGVGWVEVDCSRNTNLVSSTQWNQDGKHHIIGSHHGKHGNMEIHT